MYKIKFILILLLFGCNTIVEPTPIYEFELNTELEQDSNGYYHLPMITYNNSQVLHKLSVNTNNPNSPQLVSWYSDTVYEIYHMGFTQQIEIINKSSYTFDDGIAYTMFGPYMDQVGDTITILTGYIDSHTSHEYMLTFEIILDLN